MAIHDPEQSDAWITLSVRADAEGSSHTLRLAFALQQLRVPRWARSDRPCLVFAYASIEQFLHGWQIAAPSLLNEFLDDCLNAPLIDGSLYRGSEFGHTPRVRVAPQNQSILYASNLVKLVYLYGQGCTELDEQCRRVNAVH